MQNFYWWERSTRFTNKWGDIFTSNRTYIYSLFKKKDLIIMFIELLGMMQRIFSMTRGWLKLSPIHFPERVFKPVDAHLRPFFFKWGYFCFHDKSYSFFLLKKKSLKDAFWLNDNIGFFNKYNNPRLSMELEFSFLCLPSYNLCFIYWSCNKVSILMFFFY